MKAFISFLLLILLTSGNALAQQPIANKRQLPKVTIDPCTKTAVPFADYVNHINSRMIGASPLLGIHLAGYLLSEGEILNPTSINTQSEDRIYYDITSRDALNNPGGGFQLGSQSFNGSCMREQFVKPLTTPPSGNNDTFGSFEMHLGLLAGIKIGGLDYTYDHEFSPGSGMFVFKSTTTSQNGRFWLMLTLNKASIK